MAGPTKVELEQMNDELAARNAELEDRLAAQDAPVEAAVAAEAGTTVSPSGSTVTSLETREDGSLSFSVTRDGRVMHRFDGMKEQDLTDDPAKGH